MILINVVFALGDFFLSVDFFRGLQQQQQQQQSSIMTTI